MTVLTDQESSWISEVAQRLRLIQADVATSPPDKRREFLQEEVVRSLKSVPTANRKRCLEALLARFPVGGQNAQSSPMTPPAPAPPPESRAPEETLEMFLTSAATLSDEQRAAFAKRLSEAGFAWVDREALTLEVEEEFRKALGLPADQRPRLRRSVELSLLLIKLFHSLGQTALTTLGELSPHSPLLKRQQDFPEAAAQFLTGASESMEPQMRAMSRLLGGFMRSMLEAGKDFGRQHLERFKPAAIEETIRTEGTVKWWPAGPTEKERCWDKYKVLAKGIATPDLIDRQIKDCMVTIVEKTVPPGR